MLVGFQDGILKGLEFSQEGKATFGGCSGCEQYHEGMNNSSDCFVRLCEVLIIITIFLTREAWNMYWWMEVVDIWLELKLF